MPWILVAFLLILLVVFLPVVIPVVAAVEALDRWRRRGAAFVTPCLRCGRILGRSALDAADACWAENWRQWFNKHPGMIPRRVRRQWALCPRCGTQYDWDKTRGFGMTRRDFPENLDPDG